MILEDGHFALRQSEHYNFVLSIFVTHFIFNTKHFSSQNHVKSLEGEIK